MWQKISLWAQTYERYLSALAMIAGFVADNLFFTRVDLLQTQLLFAFYAVVCFVSVPLLHALEARQPAPDAPRSGLRLILPFVTQFALGGFWSGFVIFYSRSAELGSSWPFILLIVLVFLGSEYFHRYHTRLVFTSVLFFFALYSGAIFILPIYTHAIGTVTFLESGAVAVALFAFFTILLRLVAPQHFYHDVWRIRAGALTVLVAMNLFYFTNILPPLPLSAIAAGVYHEVQRVPGSYIATSETGQSWAVQYLGFAPTLHILFGEPVAAYSSVFAPTSLTTKVAHRWQHYDTAKKEWVTMSVISYPIVGGRDGGYRGYSVLPLSEAGEWRVNIETSDGRLIARLPFVVEIVSASPATETVTLK